MKTVVYRVLSQVFGVVLLIVGFGALAGGLFAQGYVSDQLSQEKITMPAEAGYKTLPQASQDALKPFAGQPMTTGDEAQVYANYFIWEHMNSACATVKDANGNAVPAIPAEKCTYSGVGGVVSATTDPAQKAAYSAVRNTLFQGEALRTSLLTAYAFWLVGTIAIWVAVAAFVIGAALLLLSFTVFKNKAAATTAAAQQTVLVS